MVFVALRGAIPVDDGADFHGSHSICLMEVDYRSPRCAIAQWTPSEGRYAVFPGSTVHHVSYVDAGIGTNLMLPGRFEYRRGTHRANMPTAHQAKPCRNLRSPFMRLYDWVYSTPPSRR